MYVLHFNDMTNTLFLKEIAPFEIPVKVYGNVESKSKRILNTFESRNSNTGVLLSGEKGNGKTMLAKKVAIDALNSKYPVIIINRPFDGEKLAEFFQAIGSPFIALLDEFEKVFDDENNRQNSMLTLLDGVFKNKILFLFTCNDSRRINTFMINRPGRIFYHFEFNTLENSIIEDYCKDKLDPCFNIPEEISNIKKFSKLISGFSFDQLQAIVEEMNRYKEDTTEAIKNLNIKPEFCSWDTYTLEIYKGKKKLEASMYSINGIPISQKEISFEYKEEKAKNNYSWNPVSIQSSNLVSFNPDRNEFIYKYEDLKIVFTKRKIENLDVSKLL